MLVESGLVESGRRPLGASAPAAPLRVLVVHNHYRSEQPSGEDRVVEQEIALLRGAGVQVAEFTRHSDDIAAMSAVGRARVIAEIPWSRRAGRAFAARLRQVRPDVVHVHNTFPMITASVIAAANDAAVPVVATLHNYRLVCPPGTLHRAGRTCDDCFGRAFPWPAVRHGCYRDSGPATLPLAVATALNRRRWWTGVDRFFAISAAQRQLLVAAGMPADRLLVKHNFVPAPPVVRADAGEYFLYLGRLAEAKGVRLLMAAWDRLTADGTGAGLPLVIAGSGDLEAEVTAWAGDRPDVRFLGLQNRDECARLTARARAVVTPSEWPETFGLVVVEAAAAGVPAVAAAHGAFVELIDAGQSGLLHEPGDPDALCAALRTVADPATSVRLGQAARARWSAGFSEPVATARLLAGYRGVLAGRAEVSV
ncbi:MAG TPA: glycosyltransferase [Sporichthyaceae bacterium]|jgi:glycosyltransferase involved in cell wall biosynthesis|nr:glycosyltransferase [Sporichthyaceae bacterium]